MSTMSHRNSDGCTWLTQQENRDAEHLGAWHCPGGGAACTRPASRRPLARSGSGTRARAGASFGWQAAG